MAKRKQATKSEKQANKESIAELGILLKYYHEQLDSGFEKTRQNLKTKIKNLQEELISLDIKEKETPARIQRYEKQLKKVKESIKISEVSPLVDKANRVAAQLADLRSQISGLELSEEDLQLLRNLM